ncbi:MAG: hypothetical protein MAG581_02293 [Deltaproteobacteria bacterium]|jgi:nitrile hydratase accessory protein|nr:hypothetical protein [Deltaproteobacteria bacterium]
MNSTITTSKQNTLSSSQEPVFAEPWEAQAFALAVKLSEQGLFTWSEWTTALAAEISLAKDQEEPDFGDTYYHYWLSALEKLLLEKSILDSTDIKARTEQWSRAYQTTPHGQPIELSTGIKQQII